MINKVLLGRIIVSFILWVIGLFIGDFQIAQLILIITAYVIIAYDVIIGAVRNIFRGEFLDELFLMLIASIGAFVLGELIEAVAIILFFQIGEIFQGYAVAKSRNTIINTMNLNVTVCHKEDGTDISPEECEIGQTILVRPGEMIPIDGIMLTEGIINCASLTGEANDIYVSVNDVVLSGSINTINPIKIKTTKNYYDSTAVKILDMIENATMKKAKSEKFITKFAHYYTPVIVALAIIVAFIPPIFLGFVDNIEEWGYKALSFLVVSCPCALVISVPLTYFAGIGAGAKNKIIIKGGSYLEDLALVENVVMDKTGTITKASLHVEKIITDYDKEEVIKIVKGLEANSNHPIALAIKELDGDAYNLEIIEEPGYGIVGYDKDNKYYAGNRKLLAKYNVEYPKIDEFGTMLYLAKDNEFIATFVLKDTIKNEAKDVVKTLNDINKNVIVLSGDAKTSVNEVCNEIGINEFHAELLPQDKINKLEEIINDTAGKTMYIGDGINDAPVLAMADIGVSMGQIGSDAAIEASDVVILNDDLSSVPRMIKIAKRTRRIVFENIFVSIGIKVAVLVLTVLGLVGIEFAIFADVGVCVIAILNAMRALKFK